jgi:hypothetical protein
MASTRNRNSPGDYQVEQIGYAKQCAYTEYKHGFSGSAYQTNFAGNGLLMGRMASVSLSDNACDVESQLFGIGSTNLVNPKAHVVPQIRPVESLSIMTRLPVILPEPLTIEHNQRPYPMR